MRALRMLLVLTLAVFLVTPALAAGEADLPKLGKITPNGPYQLWSGINSLIPEYALLKGGKGLKSQVMAQTATAFSGKTPGDVMQQTEVARNLLDLIAASNKVPKAATYKDPLGRAVTPAVVFLNAANLMDTFVRSYDAAANKSMPGLGKYYAHPMGLVRQFTGRE